MRTGRCFAFGSMSRRPVEAEDARPAHRFEPTRPSPKGKEPSNATHRARAQTERRHTKGSEDRRRRPQVNPGALLGPRQTRMPSRRRERESLPRDPQLDSQRKNTMNPLRRRLTLLLLSAAAFSTACATGRGAPPRLLGAFEGTLEIESEQLPAALELTERRGDLAGRLDVRGRMTALGSGEGEGNGFSLGLSYDTGCRGHMVLSGHLSEDGTSINGSIRAEDCTGVLGGTFSLRRVAAPF